MNRSLALEDDSVEMKQPNTQEGNQVLFRVTSLYGISKSGMELPINRSESIETGPITITLDPDSEKSCNLGIMNLESGRRPIRPKGWEQTAERRRYDQMTAMSDDRNRLPPGG